MNLPPLHERLKAQAEWLTPEAAAEHMAEEPTRAAFEAWATSIGMTLEQSSNGAYIRYATFYAWLGWRTARATLSGNSTEQQSSEPWGLAEFLSPPGSPGDKS